MACLWRGTDLPGYSNDVYDPEYVVALARGVKRHFDDARLHVLVDEYYHSALAQHSGMTGVNLIPFEGEGCGGWTNVLEAFRPSLNPNQGETRTVLVGLDTVFMRNCDWLFEWSSSPVGLPMDPIMHGNPCDAVVTFDHHSTDIIWSRYVRERERDRMAKYHLGSVPSEMMLLRAMFHEQRWSPLEWEERKLLSYKCHVRAGRDVELASLVYFHGNPKPHQLDMRDKVYQEWVRKDGEDDG